MGEHREALFLQQTGHVRGDEAIVEDTARKRNCVYCGLIAGPAGGFYNQLQEGFVEVA